MNLRDISLSSESVRPPQKPAVAAAAVPVGDDGPVRAPAEPWTLRLKYLVLTRNRHQQIRLVMSGLAFMLMSGAVLMMHLLDAAGLANHRLMWPWTMASVGGMVAIFGVIRSGAVQNISDPSLTFVQMVYAIGCAAVGYTIANSARGVILTIPAVVLMFGMFGMTQREVRIVGAYTVLAFGAASVYCLVEGGTGNSLVMELANYMMLCILTAGAMLLTGRLHGMRERSREQREALSNALERIGELATRDELTGCLNRRAMLERLSEESLRCARSGSVMCLVLLDIDHFKRVNDIYGHATGDAVLRGFAELARAQLRATDILSRWGGEEFLLMVLATDAQQAQNGVQRVLTRLSGTQFQALPKGAFVTCSAGLTECRGSESIVAAIERADKALYRAKNAGRNRLECG